MPFAARAARRAAVAFAAAPWGVAPLDAQAPLPAQPPAPALAVSARLRTFDLRPGDPRYAFDVRDPDVLSPKSARFSRDGGKLFVNALEGGTTLVYEWPSLRKLRRIVHRFGPADSALFGGATTVFGYPYHAPPPGGDPNVFVGRPVESALSVDGRWLFVPYYRRSFDRWGQDPSALAVIDAERDRVVRVLPTGPVPKYVAASPDGRLLAVTHWGDNTVALLDVSSGDPARFAYVGRLVVERVLDQGPLAGADRDTACGYCLRGTVFTADSRTLLVARMRGGGVAGFDVARPDAARYLGTVTAVAPTPRHLELSADGRTLFASSNVAGAVSRVDVSALVAALRAAGGRRVAGPRWTRLTLGRGARTIALDPSGRLLFAALNGTSEVVAVDVRRFVPVGRVAVDPFAVGLAVAPDGSGAVVTAQGHARPGGGRVGGNSLMVLRLPAAWADAGAAGHAPGAAAVHGVTRGAAPAAAPAAHPPRAP